MTREDLELIAMLFIVVGLVGILGTVVNHAFSDEEF